MRSVGDGTTTRGLTSRWAPTGTNQATRTLLLCGVAAGPIYVVVGGLQVLQRDGYDLTRHSLSHCNRAKSSTVVVPKVLTSLSTLPPARKRLRHATTVFLCTSRPHTHW